MAKAALTCSVKGHEIAYHSEGEGETILLVHGITTYSFIWRNVVRLLCDRYRVVSVDLLGCGESSKPLDVQYSLPFHAEMLHEFCKAIDLQQVHLVGHDVGGGIAQIFAVKYPKMLCDLILTNSVGHDFWPVQPIIAMRTPIIRQLAMASLDIGAFRLVVRRGLFHKERLDDELMQMFWLPMQSKEGRKAFLHFASSLDNQHLVEIEDDLCHLPVRTLVVRSDGDVYLSSAISDKLHNDIPQSRLVAIPTGGHYLQEDEPEMLAETMSQFYQSC